MAFVLRPRDLKVLSISRRKIHCHELMYARYDPASGLRPAILFEDFILTENEIGSAIEKAKSSNNAESMHQLQHVEPMHAKIPDHVLSIKCLSDHKRNDEYNSPCLDPIPSSMKEEYTQIPQPIDLGEYVPEPLKRNKDLLLEEIKRFKSNAQQSTLTDSIRKALNKVVEEINNEAPKRGALSRKRRIKTRGVVSEENLLDEKRIRKNSDWPKSVVVYEKTDVPENTSKRVLTGIQPLDRVAGNTYFTIRKEICQGQSEVYRRHSPEKNWSNGRCAMGRHY